MMKMTTLIGLLCLGSAVSYAQNPSDEMVHCDNVSLEIDETKRSSTVKGTVSADIDQEDAETAVAVVILKYKNSPVTQRQEAGLEEDEEGNWSGDFQSLRKHKGLESATIMVYTYNTDGKAKKCLMVGEEEPSEMAELTLL